MPWCEEETMAEEQTILLKSQFENETTRPSSIVLECINQSHNSYLYTACLAVGNAADAVEIMCIGYVMSEIDATTKEKEFLSSAVFFGMLCGGLCCGYFSDRIGRKPCLQYSLAINSIAGLASAFAPSVTVLILIRIVAGLGIGGSVPSIFTLGAELFPAVSRGRFLSIVASFWMVGAVYAGLAGWIILGNDIHGDRIMPHLGWRSFAIVCSIPAFVAWALCSCFLPESPRFLMTSGQFGRAAKVLTEMSGTAVFASNLKLEPSNAQSDTPFFALFRDGLMKQTCLHMAIWFTLCFGSYGISSWITVLFENIGLGNVYLSAFIFTLANLPGNAASIALIEIVGRRKMLAVGMVLAAFSAIGFGVGSKSPVAVVVCASLFNAFSVMGWNALDCLSVESFPTPVRTTAMGCLTAAGRFGAISAMFVNGTLSRNVPVLVFVTSSCMLIGGFSALLLDGDASGHALD